MATMFTVVGLIAAGLLIAACWLESRDRARHREDGREHSAGSERTGNERSPWRDQPAVKALSGNTVATRSPARRLS